MASMLLVAALLMSFVSMAGADSLQPDDAADAAHTRSCEAFWRRSAFECGIVVFRHVPKTGGSSISHSASVLKAHCWWTLGHSYRGVSRMQKAIHRGPPLPSYETFYDLFSAHVNASAATRALYPRLFLESHCEQGPYRAFLPERPRIARAWPRCRMRLFALIREPLAQKLSQWSFFRSVRGPNPSFVRDYTRCIANASRTREGCGLQLEYILPSVASLRLLGHSDADVQRHALAFLDADPSIFLGTFENFSTSLLLFSHESGVPLARLTIMKKAGNTKRSAAAVEAMARARAELGAQGSPARAHLRRVLALDHWFHETVTARLHSALERALAAPFGHCLAPRGWSVATLAHTMRERYRRRPKGERVPLDAAVVERATSHLQAQHAARCRSDMNATPCARVGYPPAHVPEDRAVVEHTAWWVHRRDRAPHLYKGFRAHVPTVPDDYFQECRRGADAASPSQPTRRAVVRRDETL